MKSLTYIACPYGHPDREVIDYRMDMFYKVDAHLVRQGKCPISPMNKIYMVEKEKLDTSWDFWEPYSYALIHVCSELVVVTVKGWEESFGVRKEIEFAESLGLEIIYFNPTTLE